MIDQHHGWNISFKPPILGFVLSLILTVAIYLIATKEHLKEPMLTGVIFGLGAVQVLIQLFFSFHLGLESKPHWSSITFLFMLLITLVIVGGSIWIMNNLNYHMM